MLLRRPALVLVLVMLRLACCCFPPGPTTPPPETTLTPGLAPTVGSIERVTDTVERGPDATMLVQVTDKTDFYAGDTVRLNPGGEGRLDFKGGLALRLINDAQMQVVRATVAADVPLDVAIYLYWGGFTGDLTATGGQAVFETPSGATIKVLGTEFWVVHDNNTGVTTVQNVHGTVEVTAAGVTLALGNGEITAIAPGQPPLTPVPLGWQAADFEDLARRHGSTLQAAADAVKTSGLVVMVGPTPTFTPAVPNAPRLTLWHQWTAAELAAMEPLLAAYTQATGVPVDLVQQQNLDSVLANTAAGTGPDLLVAANSVIGPWAQNKYLAPLATDGAAMQSLQTDLAPLAASVTWQQQAWGLPLNQTGIALVYNRALVDVSYFPKDPLDFEFLFTAAQLYKTESGRALLCSPSFGGADAYHFAPIAFGLGVPSYVDEYGHTFLATENAALAAQWLAAMRPYAPSQLSGATCEKDFLTGQVAAWWTGPWSMSAIEAQGISYGVAPMGRPFIDSQVVVLGAAAVERGQQKLAEDLMVYLVSTKVQLQLATALRTLPAATSALDDSVVLKDDMLAGFAQALRNGVPTANTPFAAAQWGPVGDACVAIWQGVYRDPSEAMLLADKQMQEAIANLK